MTRQTRVTKKQLLAHKKHVHHVIWGSVCAGLSVLVAILWLSSQSLASRTNSLEAALATYKQPVANCSSRETWTPGTTKSFTISEFGKDRRFNVHLPSNFNAQAYYPMILFFPGKAMDASSGQKLSNFDSLPAVSVYPEPTIGNLNVLAWQGAPYSSKADDVRFVSDILDKVQGQLCIDRSKIYAAGFSNGGGFVSVLSCSLSDRISAFGIVAGAMYYPASGCTSARPSPLINIHAANDSVVPYSGSIARKLPQIDSWVSGRATANGCSPLPATTYDGALIVQTTWQRCVNGATVENVRLLHTDHVWPKDSANVLWRFFSAHSLD